MGATERHASPKPGTGICLKKDWSRQSGKKRTTREGKKGEKEQGGFHQGSGYLDRTKRAVFLFSARQERKVLDSSAKKVTQVINKREGR